jgi:polyisoprenoid-binding protein YceI
MLCLSFGKNKLIMKKFFSIVFVSAVVLASSAYTIQAVLNWKIDSEKAAIKFTMQAHGQELIGSFKGVKGDINFDEKNLEKSTINVTIDIATVSTGNTTRDGHLQGAQWFDAATAATAKFVSTKIEKTSNGYLAIGNFTIKATTQVIEIPFTYEGSKDAGTFKGTANIKRKDFNVGPADKDDPGNDIAIAFDIPVSK